MLPDLAFSVCFHFTSSSDSLLVAFAGGAIEPPCIRLSSAGLNKGDHKMHSTAVLDHNLHSIIFIMCSKYSVLSESFIKTGFRGNMLCS